MFPVGLFQKSLLGPPWILPERFLLGFLQVISWIIRNRIPHEFSWDSSRNLFWNSCEDSYRTPSGIPCETFPGISPEISLGILSFILGTYPGILENFCQYSTTNYLQKLHLRFFQELQEPHPGFLQKLLMVTSIRICFLGSSLFWNSFPDSYRNFFWNFSGISFRESFKNLYRCFSKNFFLESFRNFFRDFFWDSSRNSFWGSA